MLRLLVAAFIAVASAVGTHDGPCPTLKAMEKFNISAYQGLWYEVMKYPNTTENRYNCPSVEYTPEQSEKVLLVKNMYVIDTEQKFINGKLGFHPDAHSVGGKLVVSQFYGGETKQIFPLVLAAEYDKYAIVYHCKFDEKKNTHDDSAWILSRTKKLEGDAKTAVENYLKSHPKELDITKFVQPDFSDDACKYTKTVELHATPKP